MILRPYQSRTIERARAARRQGHRRILIVAPTGAGKTVMATSMIASAVAQFGARVLVVGHRKELIDQFYVHLSRAGLTPGIMRGQDERTDPSAAVQVGTIQTLARRDLPPADIIFVDEAHRAPGDSYQKIIEAYPKATVFGLTATPCRLDGKPLKDAFDTLIETASYSELIDEGAILAPILYAPARSVDLSKVRTVAGDYDEGQLAETMMAVTGDTVAEWTEHAEGRPTVCFAVTIAHSREIEAEFRAAGVRVAHLDGETPEQERLQILLDLEVGRVQVVTNVGVLCEGWDQPSVSCCIMACPTKSLTKWMQCAGRILRPCGVCAECTRYREESSRNPGKARKPACVKRPVILDQGSNVDRHGLPHEDRAWSLDGRAVRKAAAQYRTCPHCYAYVMKNPCEVCGFQAVGKPREVQKTSGKLERVGAPEPPKDPQRAFFDKEVAIAKKRGFAPGYPSFKFKEKFGNWPSWAWSQAVKADHARDLDWQERIRARVAERERWAMVREKQDAEAGEVLGPSETPAREKLPKRTPAVPVDASEKPQEAQMSLLGISLPTPGRERSMQDWNSGDFDESDQ